MKNIKNMIKGTNIELECERKKGKKRTLINHSNNPQIRIKSIFNPLLEILGEY